MMRVVKQSEIVVTQANAFRGGQAHISRVRWEGQSFLYKQYDKVAPSAAHIDRISEWGRSREGREIPAAFPLARVENDTGRTLGILIKEAGPSFLKPDGSPRHLSSLDPLNLTSEYSDGHRLGIMGRYLSAILLLHRAGFVVGDVKDRNVLVSSIAQRDPFKRILLVDCDSFVCAELDSSEEAFRTDINLPEHEYMRPLDELSDFYQFVLLTERLLMRTKAVAATSSVWSGLETKTTKQHFEIAKRAKRFEPVSNADWWALADDWSSMWTARGVFEYQGGVRKRVSRDSAAGYQSTEPKRQQSAPVPSRAQTLQARRLWAKLFFGLAVISGFLAFTLATPAHSWFVGSISWLPSWVSATAWWLALVGASLFLLAAWWRWLKQGWSDCWGRPIPWDRWVVADSRTLAVYLGYLLPALVVAVGLVGGHVIGSQMGGRLSDGTVAVVVDPIACTDPAFTTDREVALVASVAGECSMTGVDNLVPGTQLEFATWLQLGGDVTAADVRDASVTVTFGNDGDGGVVPLPTGVTVSVDETGWSPYSPTSIDPITLGMEFPVDAASTHLAVRFQAKAVEPSNWASGDCDGRPSESSIFVHAVFRGTQDNGKFWTVDSNAVKATVLTGCPGEEGQ